MSASSTAGVNAGGCQGQVADDKTKQEKEYKKEDDRWLAQEAKYQRKLESLQAPFCHDHYPPAPFEEEPAAAANHPDQWRPVSCGKCSNGAFWCAYHSVTVSDTHLEWAAEAKKQYTSMLHRAQAKLTDANQARLQASEAATQVRDRGQMFAQELSNSQTFESVSQSLEAILLKSAQKLTTGNPTSLEELKGCKGALDEALCVGEDVVNTVSDFICRVEEMEKDINAAAESTKRVEVAQKELQSSLDTLQSADQKFNSCRVQSEKAEARFHEVKTRLMWDMHLPLEHLLTIFKFAGEGGRRCLATTCRDFKDVVVMGRKSGHFKHNLLLLICDQNKWAERTESTNIVGHTFSLQADGSMKGSTHSRVYSGLLRSKYAVAYHNNCVYVLGGRVPTANKSQVMSNKCCVFNAEKSLQWEPIAPMINPREQFQAVMLQGQIVVFGGPDRGIAGARTAEKYDPVTDTWTAAEMLPTVREQHALVVLQNRLFLLGGLVNRQFARSVETYDITTGQWGMIQNMTSRRANCATAVFNNRIIVIGGRNNTHLLNTCEAYNPTTDTWEQMPALHTTRFNAGATVVADRLFVYGGRGINNSMHCSMEEYLPESQSWVQLEPMSSARASHFHKPAAHYEKIATIQLSNSLLVLGGGDQRSMIQGNKENYAVGEMFDLETGTWQKVERFKPLHGHKIYEALTLESRM